MLAEAGTHARAAEQGLQVVKQRLHGLEASVQEVIRAPPPCPSVPHASCSEAAISILPLRSLTYSDNTVLNTLPCCELFVIP